MPKRLDIVDKTYGRWLVIAFSHIHKGKSYWLCECECGTRKIIAGSNLTSRTIISCGCYRDGITSERNIENKTTHGQHGTPTYNSWASMLQRCTNSNVRDYENYGGRGIIVCNRWYLFEIF